MTWAMFGLGADGDVHEVHVSRVHRKKVTTVNLDMEHRAERLAGLFPEPDYRVELIANESMIWIRNERSGAVAELGEYDFALEPEGGAELEYLRKTLA